MVFRSLILLELLFVMLLLIETPNPDAMPYEKSILDYMGVPTRVVKSKNEKVEINALPIRAYVKIWNEFFRDQNVGNAAVETNGDESILYQDQVPSAKENTDVTLVEAHMGGRCLPVNRFHDYFSSCLPYPQRGPEVTIPMTGDAPVLLGELENGKVKPFESSYQIWLNGTGAGGGKAYNRSYDKTPRVAELGGVETSGAAPDPNGNNIVTGQLYTNLASVQATTINELRNAIAVQRYISHWPILRQQNHKAPTTPHMQHLPA